MIIVSLLSYALRFPAGTAIGKVSFGLVAARASRYGISLAQPLPESAFAPYHSIAVQASAVLLVASLPACFPTRVTHTVQMDRFAKDKLGPKRCYLRLEDIEQCDTMTGFKTYPEATQTEGQVELPERAE